MAIRQVAVTEPWTNEVSNIVVIRDAPKSAPVQPEIQQVKAYCGAKFPTATRIQGVAPIGADSKALVVAPKAVVPAWADQALESRIHDAVVGPRAKKADPLDPGTGHLGRRFHSSRCIFRVLAILLSILENLFCYGAYSQIAGPEDVLYNKFEAHVLMIPDMDLYLLILALTNTAYLFIYWSMVERIKMDLYRTLTTLRLVLSLPCGALCMLAVLFAENTKIYPFLCSATVLVHLTIWTYNEYQLRKEITKRVPKLRLAVAVLCGVAAVMWCQMFMVNSVFFLRDENCPSTKNNAMPVYIREINEWHCVRWKATKYIDRIPDPDASVREVFCSTSFRIFEETDTHGCKVPSRKAHYVLCPARCQDLNLGNDVVGCTVYHADSSICSAAVHMGVIEPNKGGLVKVIGRAPPSSGKYERCLRNSILSRCMPGCVVGNQTDGGGLAKPNTQTEQGSRGDLEYGVAIPEKFGSAKMEDSTTPEPAATSSPASAAATTAAPSESQGNNNASTNGTSNATTANNATTTGRTPSTGGKQGHTCQDISSWAFYFQVEGMYDLDRITLTSWTKLSTPGIWQPWKSFEASVEYSVGGNFQTRKVTLGRPDSKETLEDIELNFCESGENPPISCA